MIETFAYVGEESVGRMVACRLAAAGFQAVESPAEADAVVSFCMSQTALEDAYFEENGIIQVARSGAVVVDLSASTPEFSRELSAVATVNDLSFVEAPLVVLDMCKEESFDDPENLLLFVSGDELAIRDARPVLNELADDIRILGGAGSAQLAKAAWTLQASAVLISQIEAYALFQIAKDSAAGATMEQCVQGPVESVEDTLRAIVEERFTGDYTAEMLLGDLSAALMTADDVDLILPQAEATAHLLELMAVIGGANKAPAAVALAYGDEAACARNGLDWTRAEQTYGMPVEFGEDDEDDDAYLYDMIDGFDAFGALDDDYDDEDDDCGCGHDHGHGHSHGCGCGHDHGRSHGNPVDFGNGASGFTGHGGIYTGLSLN